MAAPQSRSRKTYEGPTAEEKIVACLIELMEAGSTPWRRPWDGTGFGHHVNLISVLSARAGMARVVRRK